MNGVYEMNEYDRKQTELCNRLREHLQSIAIFAVKAQDMDPSGDPLGDSLLDIESDLKTAMKIHHALNTNNFKGF